MLFRSGATQSFQRASLCPSQTRTQALPARPAELRSSDSPFEFTPAHRAGSNKKYGRVTIALLYSLLETYFNKQLTQLKPHNCLFLQGSVWEKVYAPPTRVSPCINIPQMSVISAPCSPPNHQIFLIIRILQEITKCNIFCLAYGVIFTIYSFMKISLLSLVAFALVCFGVVRVFGQPGNEFCANFCGQCITCPDGSHSCTASCWGGCQCNCNGFPTQASCTSNQS